MSSRARRLTHEVTVAPLPWASELVRPDPVADVTPAEPTAQQEARLAELQREAFATGYAQGERAGFEAGTKGAETMLRQLQQTLEELGELRRTMVRQTEREMVRLALSIARRIVRREVSADPELTTAMARVALDRIGEHTSATIHLNPEDHAATVGQVGEIWADGQVRILADPKVPRGGCLVESDFGCVNAGVDAQIDEIGATLLTDESRGPSE